MNKTCHLLNNDINCYSVGIYSVAFYLTHPIPPPPPPPPLPPLPFNYARKSAFIIGHIFSWFKLWKMLIQRMCPSLFSNYPKGNIRTLVWKFTLSFELKLKELLEIRTFPDSWGEDAYFFFFFFFFSKAFIPLFIHLFRKKIVFRSISKQKLAG